MEQQSYTKDCWNGPCNCPEHQPKKTKLGRSNFRDVKTCFSCAYAQRSGFDMGSPIDYCVVHKFGFDKKPWKTVCDEWN